MRAEGYECDPPNDPSNEPGYEADPPNLGEAEIGYEADPPNDAKSSAEKGQATADGGIGEASNAKQPFVEKVEGNFQPLDASKTEDEELQSGAVKEAEKQAGLESPVQPLPLEALRVNGEATEGEQEGESPTRGLRDAVQC